MRIVSHLFSVLLLLPGLFVCAAIAGLSYLAAQSSMLGLITAMLELAIAFFPLTFLLCVAWFALALMGFSTRFRQAGAITVAVLAASSTAFIVWRAGMHTGGTEPGAYIPGAIVVPGAFALAIAVWLASTEWPDPRAERAIAATAGTQPRIE